MAIAMRIHAVLISLSLAVVLAAVPLSAHAEEVDMEGTHCIDLSADDFQIAVEQGYCGADGSDLWPGAGGGDGGHDTVKGNCGRSWITVVNKRNKRAEIVDGAISSRGPITFVRWDIPWVNQHTEHQERIQGNEVRFTTDRTWDRSDVKRTGRGAVKATLLGFVITPLGPCIFGAPWDRTKITD